MVLIVSCVESSSIDLTEYDYSKLKYNMNIIQKCSERTNCFTSYFYDPNAKDFAFRYHDDIVSKNYIRGCFENHNVSYDSLIHAQYILNDYYGIKSASIGEISFLSNMVFVKGELVGHGMNTHSYSLEFYYIRNFKTDTLLPKSYFRKIGEYKNLIIMKDL